MVRRKLTLKRVDPWSVLKFGFVLNVALLLVLLVAFWIIWTVIGRLELVETFCDSIGDLFLNDINECGVNSGPLFRTVLLIGVLGVVVQTGILVFGAFLYNLIADLTGGLAFSFLDESGDATLTTTRRAETTAAATPSSTPAPYVPEDEEERAPSPSREPTPSAAPASPPTPAGTTSASSSPSRTQAPSTPRSDRPGGGDQSQQQPSRPSLWGDRD